MALYDQSELLSVSQSLAPATGQLVQTAALLLPLTMSQ